MISMVQRKSRKGEITDHSITIHMVLKVRFDLYKNTVDRIVTYFYQFEILLQANLPHTTSNFVFLCPCIKGDGTQFLVWLLSVPAFPDILVYKISCELNGQIESK